MEHESTSRSGGRSTSRIHRTPEETRGSITREQLPTVTKEDISAEAERLYKEHKLAHYDVFSGNRSISDLTDRISILRQGAGRGGKFFQHQADIISKNLDKHIVPDRDKAIGRYLTNLETATAHKDEHLNDYVDIAREDMQADEA